MSLTHIIGRCLSVCVPRLTKTLFWDPENILHGAEGRLKGEETKLACSALDTALGEGGGRKEESRGAKGMKGKQGRERDAKESRRDCGKHK